MAKHIAFFADGTWNGPGVDLDADDVYDNDPTNVWKLFDDLAGDDTPGSKRLGNEQERVFSPDGAVTQAAKYIHGVGDSKNPIVKLLGGATGAGVIKRIVRGYTYLSRAYEDGDRIHIVGFSRGAYTARALAGLVCAKGLLDQSKTGGDKEKAYIMGAAAWQSYRRERLKQDPTLLGKLRAALMFLPGLVAEMLHDDAFVPVPGISTVAVFDTVGALGIPSYDGEDERYDAFRFADTALSPKVAAGLHAVCVDDRRADFTPTLWDQAANVTQALFPGGHADVGGGYPVTGGESDLSDVAQAWMKARLSGRGLAFRSPASSYAGFAAKALGMAHDEAVNKIWKKLPNGRDFAGRADLLVHQAVLDRWGQGVAFKPHAPAPYAPGNLGSLLEPSGRPRPGIAVTL